ncbi:PQQ-dependent sugar dehydrogenase [Verrucomicrobiales bacterium]|nr:PQQ-dependent sugar dehydrogenase [Verrucomicrobiales bacterium]MDB4632431.1 PQQ-dependent sugar dehydrogenase [bacterium]
MFRRLLLLALKLIALTSLLVAGDKPQTVQEYRNQARRQEGDSERGAKIFVNERAMCSQCHTTDGSGDKAGPDLQSAGDKFSRDDLIQSVLEPSATIMMGYALTLVETHQDGEFAGIVRDVSETELVLAGVGDVRQKIPRASIKSQTTSKASFMPSGLHANLTPIEFADLIAYLESLKHKESALANAAGTPNIITKTAQPVILHPFLSEPNQFHKPVWFEEHPLVEDVYVLVEQEKARISVIDKRGGEESITLLVDLIEEVYTAPNEGLLGFDFHPDFANNRAYYIMHEIMDGSQRGMAIAKRTFGEGYLTDANPKGTSQRVLTIKATTEVHHGGGIEFGPDGLLYIGMGDGGPQEDPQGHGQDLSTLEGKLLRIDVDRRQEELPYAIPPNNPFAGHENPNVRQEIYSYGLRQAWRFSFDPENPDHLWIGDVGQNRFEEVTMVRAGENHGWNVYEGFELFSTAHQRDGESFVPPVVAFRRSHGLSITGGYVYRAQLDSPFYGVYICGDYETKRLWGITQRDRKLENILEIGTSPAKVVAFGRDREGALYIIGYDNGMIYKIDFSNATFTKAP